MSSTGRPHKSALSLRGCTCRSATSGSTAAARSSGRTPPFHGRESACSGYGAADSPDRRQRPSPGARSRRDADGRPTHAVRPPGRAMSTTGGEPAPCRTSRPETEATRRHPRERLVGVQQQSAWLGRACSPPGTSRLRSLDAPVWRAGVTANQFRSRHREQHSAQPVPTGARGRPTCDGLAQPATRDPAPQRTGAPPCPSNRRCKWFPPPLGAWLGSPVTMLKAHHTGAHRTMPSASEVANRHCGRTWACTL